MAQISAIHISTNETSNHKELTITVRVEYLQTEVGKCFAIFGSLHAIRGAAYMSLASTEYLIAPRISTGVLGSLYFVLKPNYDEVVKRVGHDIYYEAHLLEELPDIDNSSAIVSI
jgi:hypothetical protein